MRGLLVAVAMTLTLCFGAPMVFAQQEPTVKLQDIAGKNVSCLDVTIQAHEKAEARAEKVCSNDNRSTDSNIDTESFFVTEAIEAIYEAISKQKKFFRITLSMPGKGNKGRVIVLDQVSCFDNYCGAKITATVELIAKIRRSGFPIIISITTHNGKIVHLFLLAYSEGTKEPPFDTDINPPPSEMNISIEAPYTIHSRPCLICGALIWDKQKN